MFDELKETIKDALFAFALIGACFYIAGQLYVLFNTLYQMMKFG